ncbi:MAG: hypothetical protein ABIT47_03580 [Candidatus Paceibacterota bacterium]
MATIVNTPGNDNGSSAGWAVAVIVLLVVLIGGYFLWARHAGRPAAPSTNINVSLPTGGTDTGAAPAAQ